MFFEALIPAVSPESFKDEFFAKKPGFYKGSHVLHHQVNSKSFDYYLNAWEGFLEKIVFPSSGKTTHLIQTGEHNATTQKQQIQSLYAAGATLKIENLETRHPLFADLCRSLEQEVGGKAFAKGILTPPNVPGFGVHFDATDVFVVQLEGHKHWKVFEAFAYLPTQRMSREIGDDYAEQEPIAEYLLEPGDMLYIPSGFPHSARCSESHSAHVTIGVDAWRTSKIVEHLVGSLAEQQESFREYIVPGDPLALNKLKIALLDIASALETAVPADTLAAFSDAFRANMPPVGNISLYNTSFQSRIDSTSTFSYDHRGMHTYVSDGEKCTIKLGCSIPSTKPLLRVPPLVELPHFVVGDLGYIFSQREPFKVADVVGALDASSKLLLLSQLCAYGVVNVVDVS